MLAKKFRLPIQTVIGKKGKILKDSYFLLNVMPNCLLYSRYGIVVSKKVSAKATERNRIKRIIFSALNPKKIPPRDFLIIVSPKIKELKKEEIIKQLKLVSSNYFF